MTKPAYSPCVQCGDSIKQKQGQGRGRILCGKRKCWLKQQGRGKRTLRTISECASCGREFTQRRGVGRPSVRCSNCAG